MSNPIADEVFALLERALRDDETTDNDELLEHLTRAFEAALDVEQIEDAPNTCAEREATYREAYNGSTPGVAERREEYTPDWVPNGACRTTLRRIAAMVRRNDDAFEAFLWRTRGKS